MRNFRRNCVRWTLELVLATGLLTLNNANASFITAGCAAVNQYCTLAELSNPSAFINIDQVVFNHFDFIGSGAIKVTPIDSPGNGTPVGLRFTPLDPALNPWFAAVPISSPSSTAAFGELIDYDANVLGGLLVGGAEMAATFIENVSGGFYNTLGAQKEISVAPAAMAATCAGANLPFAECDGATVTDAVNFLPSETFHVSEAVDGSAMRVTGGGTVQIGISQLDNLFVRVPDPATTALLAIGGAALCWSRRRAGQRADAA
ncbi:PEP-CTERM sorting domain-containing protein [Duganella hordei]|uniref:PEP-CTERM sorting domain-containing protein n=1 Tax=Duganella hordei TaxID=2865934 RepID=UPI0030E7BA98